MSLNAPPNEWASLAGSSNILASSPPLLESLTTNAGSSAGTNVLHFASVPAGIVAGMQVNNQTHAASLPTYVTVMATTLTTVTLSANVQAPGVSSGDTIVFSTYNVLTQGGIPVNTPLHYTAPASHIIDAGYVTQASLNATAVFVGSPVGQNILAVGSILTTADILGAASTALINGWVELAISQDAVTWGPWQKFVPGVQSGRAFQFRIAMESADAATLAICTAFNYKVQIPARIDHYQNQTISGAGTTLTFQPDNAATPGAFNGGPAANNLPYVSVAYPQQTARLLGHHRSVALAADDHLLQFRGLAGRRHRRQHRCRGCTNGRNALFPWLPSRPRRGSAAVHRHDGLALPRRSRTNRICGNADHRHRLGPQPHQQL